MKTTDFTRITRRKTYCNTVTLEKKNCERMYIKMKTKLARKSLVFIHPLQNNFKET